MEQENASYNKAGQGIGANNCNGNTPTSTQRLTETRPGLQCMQEMTTQASKAKTRLSMREHL